MAFREAVNDYVALCKQVAKPASKSFKGSFNVRVSPEVHRKAYRKALKQGKTLNQFVKDAASSAGN